MNEFNLIDCFFKSIAHNRNDVVLGIGDDAASVQIPKNQRLLVSTDTLVSGVHFLAEWNPYDIAYRAAMVTISDMAAMAAEPSWATLAITLPELDASWLKLFSNGLKAAFTQYNVALIGGDTTKGPLSITVTIMGTAPEKNVIKRSGAKPQDSVWVSGVLGAAALAVRCLTRNTDTIDEKNILMNALLHPKPRIDLCPILHAYASSAIDISDGLSADLNHICTASGVGASIIKDHIPVHPLVTQYLKDEAYRLALGGGDDYELCFTVPQALEHNFMQELHTRNITCYRIGIIEKQHGLRIKLADDSCIPLEPQGYSHF